MYRKPVFWIAFVVVVVLCILFSYRFFDQAIPLVTLDLRMDREAALAAARQLSSERGWGPESFRQAASFAGERREQSFVELEGGGKEALHRMLSEGLYASYTWRVRHFRPGETTETRIRFTPAGEPYGFAVTLPEDEPGPSLPSAVAREIAERAAVDEWTIDLGVFELVESAQEVRPGGRTDHTFVYERREETLGEGRYRLRLGVGGDRFTELRHFIKVPEGFSRRFEQMRSANEAIGVGALVAMGVLLFGGSCVGLFFLLRRRWVIWKQALVWGLVVALLQALAALNEWPLRWMNYDTAVSPANYVLQTLAMALLVFVIMGAVLALSFMAAESLTRRAFPDQVQLWRAWSPAVAGSPSVLGWTVAGYLLVALFCAYEVALYSFSHRFLGWWTPSDALLDPDVLATWFPWLGSIAASLQAGFWEECLFRAVPLAGAALLGRRFGRPRLWIFSALILQAIIFGAAHAPYPAMPAYARVVELIIPAIVFGLVYLRFGLVPVIVLHFAIDVFFIGLPLLASAAPGAWIDQGLLVLITLVPLWVVLGARWRRGRWAEVGEEYRNRSWTPPAVAAAAPAAAAAPERRELGTLTRWLLPAAGLVGLVLWLLSAPFTTDAPALGTDRAAAEAAARGALAERGVELGDEWEVLSGVVAEVELDHGFVWREGERELYRALLGSYLDPPGWRVRFVRFTGDVAERAEEYQVVTSPRGEVVRVTHRLPEARAGAELSEQEARAIAHGELRAGYGLDPQKLREVSAIPSQQPARRDWELVFADPASFPLAAGEARIAVRIAGDEVVDRDRFVHVPEEWERSERNRRTLAQVVAILRGSVFVLLFVAGAVVAVVKWSRKKQFAVKVFLAVAALLLVVYAVNFFNGWATAKSNLSTAQPLVLQLAMLVGLGLMGVVALSAVVALGSGLVHGLKGSEAASGRGAVIVRGLALGALVAGLAELAARLGPSLAPPWPEYSTAGDLVPLAGAALGSLGSFVVRTTAVLLVLTAVDRLTRGWTRRRVLYSVLLVLTGPILAGTEAETVPWWLAAGLLAGLVWLAAYVLVLRQQLSLLPLAVAALMALGELREAALMAYPAALPGGVVGAVLILLLGWYWSQRLAAEGSVQKSVPTVLQNRA